jgi:protein arginine N-methyltransferase 1
MDTDLSLEERLIHSSLNQSDYYWNSYAHFGIHEEMLKDKVRTCAYRDSILNNKHLFKGKVVLDVGCGTGILSLFCAKAGAERVYAVEFSDIIAQARQIAIDNGFEDKIVFIKQKMEEVELPEKVDIIISEWMGYFLLYESMLGSVINARNKFLKPGGIILPDKANIYVALIEDHEYKSQKLHFWDQVYGYDFSCIKALAFREPIVDSVDAEALISESACIYSLDLLTCEVSDLDFSTNWEVKITLNDYAHALIGWFDVEFSACHKPIRFSTAPYSAYTHWKQTVFYLAQDIRVNKGDSFYGTLSCKPSEKNPRELDIEIRYLFEGKFDSLNLTQNYQIK